MCSPFASVLWGCDGELALHDVCVFFVLVKVVVVGRAADEQLADVDEISQDDVIRARLKGCRPAKRGVRQQKESEKKEANG